MTCATLFVPNTRTEQGSLVCELVVGGLSLLRRSVRTLQRKGVVSFRILVPEGELERLQRHLEGDPELKSELQWAEHEVDTLAKGLSLLPSSEGMGWVLDANRLITTGLLEHPGEGACALSDGARDAGVYFVECSELPSEAAEVGAYLSALPRVVGQRPLWAEINGVDDLGQAKLVLRQMLRKPLSRSADGLTAYFINRPISIEISTRLVNSPLTPNHITAIGLLMGLLAAFFVASGMGWWSLALGGFLLQASSVLDGVDGELARMRLTFSTSGEWFDTVCDDIINISFLLALGWLNYQLKVELAYWSAALIIAGLTSTTIVFWYYELIKSGLASHNHVEWGFEKAEKASVFAKIAIGFAWLAKRDSYTLILMLLTFFNLPLVAFVIMAAGASIVFLGSTVQIASQHLRKASKGSN